MRGRSPWDQGPRDEQIYVAAVRYNRKDRRSYIDGTKMLFAPSLVA